MLNVQPDARGAVPGFGKPKAEVHILIVREVAASNPPQSRAASASHGISIRYHSTSCGDGSLDVPAKLADAHRQEVFDAADGPATAYFPFWRRI